MAYNISLTNGEPLVTIADGTVDVNFTSLSLVGKNYPNYGKLLNENFVKLLENFAGTDEPTNPLMGQVWFDTNAQSIKVRTASDYWKTIGSQAQVSSVEPTDPDVGDTWWDSVRKQLYVFDGIKWVLVGPAFSAQTGTTGSLADVVKDIDNNNHIVIKFYVNNSVTGIWCKEDSAFTLAPASIVANFFAPNQDPILKPGLNMAYSELDTDGKEKNTIWGSADNAYNLDGVAATNYVRKDNSAGKQTVDNPVEITRTLEVGNVVIVGDKILPADTEISDIGSTQAKFNNIYAKKIIADELTGAAGIVDTDDIAEGSQNRFFTQTREDFVRNWANITNKPVLVSNITFDGNTKTVNVTKTDNSVSNIGSIVGYTGSKGEQGLPGSALWRNFTQDTPSPGPADFTTENITAFSAYSSTDFPAGNSNYYVGINIRSGGAPAAQLAMNWNTDENAPTGIYFRTNDDTGNTATWSAWTKILTQFDVAASNNQVIFKNSAGTLSGSASLLFDGTNLTVAGDITAFSDSALKTNIETITDPLSIVRGLRGVTYDRIDTGQPGIGLLADDAERAVPRAVKTNKDGIRSLNYNGVSGVLVEAIKKLEAEINELKVKLKNKE